MRVEVALSFLKGLGPIRTKHMISKLESNELVFQLPLNDLHHITGISKTVLLQMDRQEAMSLAERELETCEKQGIKVHFFSHDTYPRRLRQCPDAPIVLYQKGTANLNARRVVSMVGTRSFTEYGKEIVQDFIEGIASSDILVVSGLALGIDSLAHSACVRNAVPTAGVLGHGLSEIFPKRNARIAKEMLQQEGAWVTEYSWFSSPVRENFPVRNRIVAGLCDALVVVESQERGGSLITAEFANDYNRDVFAFPGSVKQRYSAGCNLLIQQQKAHLIHHHKDFLNFMGWEEKRNKAQQMKLAVENSEEEKNVLTYFCQFESLYFDEVVAKSCYPASKIHGILLSLQMKGQLSPLGGNRFSLR